MPLSHEHYHHEHHKKKTGIAGFFEDHNIPPLFMLLLLLALLIPLIMVLMYYLQAPSEVCGDGVCGPGEVNCPADCAPLKQLHDVRVEVLGNISGIVQISLEDSEGNLITTNTGRINGLSVSGVTANGVVATVRNLLNNISVDSGAVLISDATTLIQLELPPNFFYMGSTKVNLRLRVDEVFNETPLSVKVYDINGNLIAERQVDDIGNIVLDLGRPLVYIEVTSPSGMIWRSDTIDLAVDLMRAEEMNATTPGQPTSDRLVNLSCGDAGGDLTGDGVLDNNDLPYLVAMLDKQEEFGFAEDVQLASPCADLNGDGRLTTEDYECMVGILDNTYNSFDECPDCEPLSQEICNDGIDNDCDGQTDRDNYDEAAQRYYPYDVCSCNVFTPCETVYDSDGLFGLGAGQARYCAAISELGGEHIWRSADDLKCDSGRSCDTLTCGGKTYVCGCLCPGGNCTYSWRTEPEGTIYLPALLSGETPDGCCPPPQASALQGRWGILDEGGLLTTEDLLDLRGSYGMGAYFFTELNEDALDFGQLKRSGILLVKVFVPELYSQDYSAEDVRAWAEEAASRGCIDALGVEIQSYSAQYPDTIKAIYEEAQKKGKMVIAIPGCTLDSVGEHWAVTYSDLDEYSDAILPRCYYGNVSDYGDAVAYVTNVEWPANGVTGSVYPLIGSGDVTYTRAEVAQAVPVFGHSDVAFVGLYVDDAAVQLYREMRDANTTMLYENLRRDYSSPGLSCSLGAS